MDSFSVVLRQLIDYSELSMRDLAAELKQSGSNISYPALAAYKNYYSVPPFDRARQILDMFQYEISDDELIAMLEYSRSELKSMREDNYSVIQQGLRIPASQFGQSYNAIQVRDIIDQRIEELLPENGNFNAYVTYLIKNDLIMSGYLTKEG